MPDSMQDKTSAGVHWGFWAIGVAALIWNLMGSINFIWQMNADGPAALPEAYRALIEVRPAWATAGFAVAVFGGALGCVLLLLRRSAAYYLFVASLVGVLVQMPPNLGMAGAPVGFEVSMRTLMPPVMSLVVAAFLIWYSKRAERRGWIGQE